MKVLIFALANILALTQASILLEPAQSKSYENYSVLRIEVHTKEEFDLLSTLGDLHFWNEGRVGGHADVMVSPDALQEVQRQLLRRNFQFSTMIENVGKLMLLEKVPAGGDRDEVKAEHPMTWTEYHSQDDIEAYLDYLAATYDFVEVESIGESFEGRPMRVIKACKGGCGNKPAMWIDGGIHAREWIGPASVSWMIKEVIENDADHPELLENLDWYILPIHNPDGYAYSQSSDRMWRKTRSSHPGIGLCKGTDANRNYGYHWNDGGSSNLGCSDTYMGPEAFSEVENRNVRDFILAHKDQIKFFNTIHSYSQLILLPWGFTTENAPGYDKLMNMANKGNEALYAVHQTSYEAGCIPCLLYVASGGSMDWALGEAGIPYSYGMELRDTGRYGFILPADQIIPTAEETWAFHKTAAEIIIQEFAQ